jgi:hypothetical protein
MMSRILVLGFGFTPAAPHDRRLATLVVDIAKVDASWREDVGFYLPPGEGLRWGEPRGFLDTLTRKRRPVRMPCLILHPRGNVGFVDGRHRFALFRDLGATSIPVRVDRCDLAGFKPFTPSIG